MLKLVITMNSESERKNIHNVNFVIEKKNIK